TPTLSRTSRNQKGKLSACSTTRTRTNWRNGTETHELAPLKKSIYSLTDLREILTGCNRHYLEFLSSLDEHSDGRRKLKHLSESKTENDIRWRGFNFFDPDEQKLLRAIKRPEYNIRGRRGAAPTETLAYLLRPD
ncbi:MAG: hypothetical protein PHT15_07170, partial [Gallionellaceae bacterium]|nr:hypothetical protein [Gallionellaceae bacterium]